MAGSEKVGTLVYDIEIDTAGLLEGQRKLQAQLDSLRGNLGGFNATINRTEQSTRAAGSSMSSLSAIARGLAAAISVNQVVAYANAWVDVNNKLANSVRANEQVADVTKRVFDISQQTMSSLGATATLYGRLERATRSAGTSTADLVKLTTTINKGLAVSGATTEEASSTMTQLSQALASGVLRGEEFNSISENGSRLAVGLADSLGVTIGQLRKMAAQGKLTTEVVVNGLLKQSDVIGKEFANTTVTMGQAFTTATNNITKFVGENSSVGTTLNIFNKGVITLSENLNSVATVIGAVSVVFGSRFVGALTTATSARLKDIVAARAMSVANLQAAKSAALEATAAVRSAESAKISAMSELDKATRMKATAVTADQLAAAELRLSAARLEATATTAAYNSSLAANALAQKAAAAAARSANIALSTLRAGLALVGGPAGALMVAAAAVYYFFQRTQEARNSAFAFADSISSVVKKMQEMSNVELAAEVAKASQATKVQTSAIEDQQAAVSKITKDIDNQTASMRIYGSTASKLQSVADLTDELAIETAKLAKMEDDRSRTVNSSAIIQAKLSGTLLTGNDLLDKNSVLARISAGAMTELGKRIDNATGAKQRFNATSLRLEVTPAGQKMLDNLDEENKLLAMQDKRLRAVTKAEDDAKAAGETNPNVVTQIGEKAGRLYDLQKAEQERTKAANEATSADKKQANAQESVAQKLANLKQQSELAADSTVELSRAQAILTAQQSLGKTATQAQIQLAGDYAARKWDTANAIRAQAAAEKLVPETKENASYAQDVKDLSTALAAKKITQQQYNTTAEQIEQEHQNNLAKIKSEKVITPQQQAAGIVDPVQQLANENAQKLALIQQFEANKTLTEQQGIALRNAANTEYEKARTDAQWAIFEQQNTGYKVLGAAIDGFSSQAASSLTGLITGTESASDAFKDLGNSILNSVIQALVEVGIQYLKNAAMAMIADKMTSNSSSTAAAQTATAWAPAAAAASIGTFGGAAVAGIAGMVAAYGISTALAGKRKNGGPVSAGSMYEVGEGGLPEIYKASNGSQYMIPGNNGSVISNKDLQSGNGVNVVINFTDQTSGSSHSFNASASESSGVVTVDAFLNDLDNGGILSQGMAERFGLSRKATGAL